MPRKAVAKTRCALCGAKDISEPRGEEKYCRDCWDKKIAVEEIVAREFALKRYIRAHSAEKYLIYHSTLKRPFDQSRAGGLERRDVGIYNPPRRQDPWRWTDEAHCVSPCCSPLLPFIYPGSIRPDHASRGREERCGSRSHLGASRCFRGGDEGAHEAAGSWHGLHRDRER